ncbi:hypothetical protein Gotur_007939 [Gossypium turneri]
MRPEGELIHFMSVQETIRRCINSILVTRSAVQGREKLNPRPNKPRKSSRWELSQNQYGLFTHTKTGSLLLSLFSSLVICSSAASLILYWCWFFVLLLVLVLCSSAGAGSLFLCWCWFFVPLLVLCFSSPPPRLGVENQRTAAAHGTLRQELAVTQHELQILHAQIGAITSEREQKKRSLTDKIAKMEAELQAAEPVKVELQQAHSDAQNLVFSLCYKLDIVIIECSFNFKTV